MAALRPRPAARTGAPSLGGRAGRRAAIGRHLPPVPDRPGQDLPVGPAAATRGRRRPGGGRARRRVRGGPAAPGARRAGHPPPLPAVRPAPGRADSGRRAATGRAGPLPGHPDRSAGPIEPHEAKRMLVALGPAVVAELAPRSWPGWRPGYWPTSAWPTRPRSAPDRSSRHRWRPAGPAARTGRSGSAVGGARAHPAGAAGPQLLGPGRRPVTPPVPTRTRAYGRRPRRGSRSAGSDRRDGWERWVDETGEQATRGSIGHRRHPVAGLPFGY